MIIPPHNPEHADRKTAGLEKAQQLINMVTDQDKLDGAQLGRGLSKPVTGQPDSTLTGGSAQ